MSPVRTERGMFVRCCMQCCMRVCAVLRRYINVRNSDVSSIVNMYPDNMKFCVVCINVRRYVCCSECYVVSNECDEPTPWGPTE